MAAMTHQLTSKYWATFNQWRELGGRVMRRPENVKPGHWGQSIVFFTRITKTEVDPTTGQEEETSFPLLKTYCVFNVDQVDGPFDHFEWTKSRSRSMLTSSITSPLKRRFGYRGQRFASAGIELAIHRRPTISSSAHQASFQARERILWHDLPRTCPLDRP